MTNPVPWTPIRSSLPPFILLNSMRVVEEKAEIKCVSNMCPTDDCANLTGQHIRSSFGTSGIGEDW